MPFPVSTAFSENVEDKSAGNTRNESCFAQEGSSFTQNRFAHLIRKSYSGHCTLL
jgi:hypothetical protein